MILESYLSDRRRLVEEALDRYIPAETEEPQKLHESLRYSLLSPGKRLRPILVLASCEAIGGNPQDVLPTACAMECIHVFSLIHDDLPCMDDDDYRRGRLTNHKVYGDAMALLAGDALLTVAFELIGKNGSTVSSERVVEAILMISRATA